MLSMRNQVLALVIERHLVGVAEGFVVEIGDAGIGLEVVELLHRRIEGVEVEVQDHDGQKTTIKQPRIDPTRCIGFGQCANVCVFKDSPAVRVSSANESRASFSRSAASARLKGTISQ